MTHTTLRRLNCTALIVILNLLLNELVAQRLQDTSYLLRKHVDGGNHLVFITNALSSRLEIINLITVDSAIYNQTIKTFNDSGFVQGLYRMNVHSDWYSLHRYKNQHYLYVPSEPYVNMYIGINDSTLVMNYFNDGCIPALIRGFGWKDSRTLKIATTSIYQEDSVVIFHFVGPLQDVAVVEFPYRAKDRRYHLLVSKNSMQKFPVIVNNCDGFRCAEWVFEQEDYEVLINKR